MPSNVQTVDGNMLFSERLKELRIGKQMPQRCLAAALDIDTATYCKIEKGERKAKKEHLPILSDVLCVDEDDLLTLWLADRVSDIIASDEEVAPEVLSIVSNGLKQSR
ncbi:helix-turn-helix transcriptional regulator [uncultured Porphyromonas sp.]|uniref:helix-turn-helix domain-containing protein n=1 Tax=uncultured Porphyromonas sp. TaxID=159274 RepID=UPI0025FD39B1|nr:helix-turn-helix transcriptional regulator [uncultured Porphyromonas sp.]